MADDDHHGLGAGALLDRLRRSLGMTLSDLWVGYFAVGGNAPILAVEQWLAGDLAMTPREAGLLAQAVDDAACEGDLGHPASMHGL